MGNTQSEDWFANELPASNYGSLRFPSSALASVFDGSNANGPLRIMLRTKRNGPSEMISVDLSNHRLSAMPDSLLNEANSNLHWLDLSHNSFEAFPVAIGQLQELRRLAFGNNRIRSIPDTIGMLKNLTWLDFTHNDIEEVSDAIGELSNLTGLGLSDCRLTQFPMAITKLTKLTKLGLFGNQITEIPDEICQLKSLSKLDISNNLIANVTEEISLLKELIWLNLSHNRIRALPSGICELNKLQELGLGNNLLSSLPDLSGLKDLKILPIFTNRLKKLEPWISSLHSLEKIDCSTNELETIPVEIFFLPRLTYLNIRRNRINSIPIPDIWNFELCPTPISSLTYFICSDNLLKDLPFGLLKLPIREWQLRNNPFSIFDGPDVFQPFSLTKIAATAVSRYLPSSALKLLILEESPFMTPLMKKAFKGLSVCHVCCRYHVSAPILHSHYQQVDPQIPAAPFVRKVCSFECKNSNSAMY